MPISTPFALASALVLFLAAPPPTSAPVPSARAAKIAGQNTLRDRVLAIVDEDPILDSDVLRIVGIGLAQPDPRDADRGRRRRVSEHSIEALMRILGRVRISVW